MRYWLVYLVLLLSGCTPLPITFAPPKFNAQSKNGAIAGTVSIAMSDTYFDSYTIFFKKAASDNKTQYSITVDPYNKISMKLKADYFVGNKLVYQFLTMLVPGEYEFTQIRFYKNKAIVQETLTSKGTFLLPFTVTAAEISYVGDIIIDFEQCKRSEQLLTWKDNCQRELAEFRERLPELDWSTFKNRTITRGYFSYPNLIEFEK